MSDALATAGIIGGIVGLAIVAIAVVAMIARLREPAQRTRALGFALVGASVVAVSGALFLLSRLGDRLPLVAGVPVIAFLLVVAFVLRLAASREFRRYRSYISEG